MLMVHVVTPRGARVLEGFEGARHQLSSNPQLSVLFDDGCVLISLSRGAATLNGQPMRPSSAERLHEGDVVEWLGGSATVRRPPRLGAEEAALVAAAQTSVDARLVYADWLESRGAVLSAEYLRLETRARADGTSISDGDVMRLRWLTQRVGASFRGLISRAKLENCNLTVKFECPKKWQALTPTDNPRERHCAACDQVVTFCNTVEEAMDLVGGGRCVAIEVTCARSALDLDQRQHFVGEVAAPEELSEEG